MKKTILTILFLLTLTQAKEIQVYESPTVAVVIFGLII